MERLDRSFYVREPLIVARELLGKHLVRELKGHQLISRIVETEAYLGIVDKAAHSYGGRRTSRNEVMYGIGGLSYVFLIYGMYDCLNTVTEQAETPTAVLIRAVEPLQGIEHMSQNRFSKSYTSLSKYQASNLTNGPGKLCKALQIDRSLNGIDLCYSDDLYICQGNSEPFEVDTSSRIGIDYAEEYKDVPWRFFIKNNKFVSPAKGF